MSLNVRSSLNKMIKNGSSSFQDLIASEKERQDIESADYDMKVKADNNMGNDENFSDASSKKMKGEVKRVSRRKKQRSEDKDKFSKRKSSSKYRRKRTIKNEKETRRGSFARNKSKGKMGRTEAYSSSTSSFSSSSDSCSTLDDERSFDSFTDSERESDRRINRKTKSHASRSSRTSASASWYMA